jgi:hypothetical protein
MPHPLVARCTHALGLAVDSLQFLFLFVGICLLRLLVLVPFVRGWLQQLYDSLAGDSTQVEQRAKQGTINTQQRGKHYVFKSIDFEVVRTYKHTEREGESESLSLRACSSDPRSAVALCSCPTCLQFLTSVCRWPFLRTQWRWLRQRREWEADTPLAGVSAGRPMRDTPLVTLDGETTLSLTSLVRPGRLLLLNFGSCS